jgi:hypothetical protein
MNNNITFGAQGPQGQPGPTGMNWIEYRKSLRVRKINKLIKIWDLTSAI